MQLFPWTVSTSRCCGFHPDSMKFKCSGSHRCMSARSAGVRARLCGSAYFCPSFKEPLSSLSLVLPLSDSLNVTLMSSLLSLQSKSALLFALCILDMLIFQTGH